MGTRQKPNLQDKRCELCRQVFTPVSGRQIYCKECRDFLLACGRDKAKAKALVFHKAELSFAPGCDGCVYWREAGTAINACHYLLDEGHKRPCVPGKNCTVRRDKA